MIDVKPTIVSTLSNVLPIQYELFLDSDTTLPCLTYSEYKNNDNKTGDTFGYSEIGISISVWTNGDQALQEQAEYARQVDSAMRSLGFKRRNSAEMVDNGTYRKILDYECLGIEIY